MALYCCEDIINECNGYITIQYLKNISSLIQNSDGSIYVVPTSDPNWTNTAYTPTYAELTGGVLMPQHSNGVDGISITGTYSSGDKVLGNDIILTYYRLSSFTLSNSNTVINACGGSSTTSANVKFVKYVKHCGSGAVESEAMISNYEVTWDGTNSGNTGTKTFDKNGIYDSECPGMNASQRTVEVTAYLNWRGWHQSSNSITITQNADEFDHLVTVHSSAVTDVTVVANPWDFRNNCSGGTAEATAYYSYEEWDSTERVSKCGVSYCVTEKTNVTSGTSNLPSSSHTVDICNLYETDPSYNEGDVYTFTFYAEKDGIVGSDNAKWSCNNCGDCPDIVSCTYISGYAEMCGSVFLAYKETRKKQRKNIDGTCEIYETIETNKEYVMSAPANETSASRIISVTPPDGCLTGNSYNITQEAGPCNGCVNAQYHFTLPEITVPCNASNATTSSVTYTLVTTYSNCADDVTTGNVTVNIPAMECNYGSRRIIKDGSGLSASSLSEAVANVKIYQAGDCDCCSPSSVYEFDSNGITIPCTGLSAASSVTIAYTATTTSSKCQVNTTSSATTISVGPYACNALDSAKTIQSGQSGTTLSTAKPKIIQIAGPCCDCTSKIYNVSGVSGQIFTINDTCGGSVTINPTVEYKCTAPYVDNEWIPLLGYTFNITSGAGGNVFTIEDNTISIGMKCTSAEISGTFNYTIYDGTTLVESGNFIVKQITGICNSCDCQLYGDYVFQVNGPSDIDEDNIDPCGGIYTYNVTGKRKCLSPSSSTEYNFTNFIVSYNGSSSAVSVSNKTITFTIPKNCSSNATQNGGDFSITYRANTSDSFDTVKTFALTLKQPANSACSSCDCETWNYSLENNTCPNSVTFNNCNGVNDSFSTKVVQTCTTASTKTAYTSNYTVEWTQTDLAIHSNFVTLNGLSYTASTNCTDSARTNTFTAVFKDGNGNTFKSCSNIVFTQPAGPCGCPCTEWDYDAELTASSTTVSNCGGNGSLPIKVYAPCKSPFHEQKSPSNEISNYKIIVVDHTPSNPAIYTGYESGLTVTFDTINKEYTVSNANCDATKGYYKEVEIKVYKTDDTLIKDGLIFAVKQEPGKCAAQCGCDETVYSAVVTTSISVDECNGSGSVPIIVYSRCNAPVEQQTSWAEFNNYTVRLIRISGDTFLTLPNGIGNSYSVSQMNCTTDTPVEKVKMEVYINGSATSALSINNSASTSSTTITFTQEEGPCENCECVYNYKPYSNKMYPMLLSCSGGTFDVWLKRECDPPIGDGEWYDYYTDGLTVNGNSSEYSDGFISFTSTTSGLTAEFNPNCTTGTLSGEYTIYLNGVPIDFSARFVQDEGICCECETYCYKFKHNGEEIYDNHTASFSSCGGNSSISITAKKKCTYPYEESDEKFVDTTSGFTVRHEVVEGSDFITISNDTAITASYTVAPNCTTSSRSGMIVTYIDGNECNNYVGGAVEIITQAAGKCDDGSCGCVSWAHSADCISPTAITINSCGENDVTLTPRVREYCTAGGTDNNPYNNYTISSWTCTNGDNFVTLNNNAYTAAKNCSGRTLSGTYSYKIVDNSGNTVLKTCSISFTQDKCNDCACTQHEYSASPISDISGIGECSGSTGNITISALSKCAAPNPDPNYSSYSNFSINWTVVQGYTDFLSFSNNGKTYTVKNSGSNCTESTRSTKYNYTVNFNSETGDILHGDSGQVTFTQARGKCSTCPCTDYRYSAMTFTLGGSAFTNTADVTYDKCSHSVSVSASISGRCFSPDSNSWVLLNPQPEYKLEWTYESAGSVGGNFLSSSNSGKTVTLSQICTDGTNQNTYYCNVMVKSGNTFVNAGTFAVMFRRSNLHCGSCSCSNYSYSSNTTCDSTSAYTIDNKCGASGYVNTPTVYKQCESPYVGDTSLYSGTLYATWTFTNVGTDLVDNAATATTTVSGSRKLQYHVGYNCTQSSRYGEYTIAYYANTAKTQYVGTCRVKISQNGEMHVCDSCTGTPGYTCYNTIYSAVCSNAIIDECDDGADIGYIYNVKLYRKCANPLESTWHLLSASTDTINGYYYYNIEVVSGNGDTINVATIHDGYDYRVNTDEWEYEVIGPNCTCNSRSVTYTLKFKDYDGNYLPKDENNNPLTLNVTLTQDGGCTDDDACPCESHVYSANTYGVFTVPTLGACSGSSVSIPFSVKRKCSAPCSISATSSYSIYSNYTITWEYVNSGSNYVDFVNFTNYGKTAVVKSNQSNCSQYASTRYGYYKYTVRDNETNELIKSYSSVLFTQTGETCPTCPCLSPSYSLNYNNDPSTIGEHLVHPSYAGDWFSARTISISACAVSSSIEFKVNTTCTNPYYLSMPEYTGPVRVQVKPRSYFPGDSILASNVDICLSGCNEMNNVYKVGLLYNENCSAKTLTEYVTVQIDVMSNTSCTTVVKNLFNNTVTINQTSGQCENCQCLEFGNSYSVSGTCPTTIIANRCGSSGYINVYLTRYCNTRGAYELDTEPYDVVLDYDNSGCGQLIKEQFNTGGFSVRLESGVGGARRIIWLADKFCGASGDDGARILNIQFKKNNTVVASCNCVGFRYQTGYTCSDCCDCDELGLNETAATFDYEGNMISPSVLLLSDNMKYCNLDFDYDTDAFSSVTKSGSTINIVTKTPTYYDDYDYYYIDIYNSDGDYCDSIYATIEGIPCNCSTANLQFYPDVLPSSFSSSGYLIGTFSAACNSNIAFKHVPDNTAMAVTTARTSYGVSGEVRTCCIGFSNNNTFETIYHSFDVYVGGNKCNTVIVPQKPLDCNCANHGGNIYLSNIPSHISPYYHRFVGLATINGTSGYCEEVLIATTSANYVHGLTIYGGNIIAESIDANNTYSARTFTVHLRYQQESFCRYFTITQDAKECDCQDSWVSITGSTVTIQNSGTTSYGTRIGNATMRHNGCPDYKIVAKVYDSNGDIVYNSDGQVVYQTGITAIIRQQNGDINYNYYDVNVVVEPNNTVFDKYYTVIVERYPFGTSHEQCQGAQQREILVKGHECGCSGSSSNMITFQESYGSSYSNYVLYDFGHAGSCYSAGYRGFVRYNVADNVCNDFISVENENPEDFSVSIDKEEKLIYITALTSSEASGTVRVYINGVSCSNYFGVTKPIDYCGELPFNGYLEFTVNQIGTQLLTKLPYGGGTNAYYLEYTTWDYDNVDGDDTPEITISDDNENVLFTINIDGNGNVYYYGYRAFTGTQEFQIYNGLCEDGCYAYIRVKMVSCNCSSVTVTPSSATISADIAMNTRVDNIATITYDTSCGQKPVLSSSTSAMTVGYSGNNIYIIPRTNEYVRSYIALRYGSNVCKTLTITRNRHCECGDVTFSTAPFHAGEKAGTVLRRPIKNASGGSFSMQSGCYQSLSGECTNPTAFTVSYPQNIQSNPAFSIRSLTNEAADGWIIVHLLSGSTSEGTLGMTDIICGEFYVYKDKCGFEIYPSDSFTDCEGETVTFGPKTQTPNIHITNPVVPINPGDITFS